MPVSTMSNPTTSEIGKPTANRFRVGAARLITPNARLTMSSAVTPGKAMGERLNDLGLGRGRIGLAGVRNVGRASMSAEHQRDLMAAMPDATFEDAMEVMQTARMIKSAEEIAWFEKGAEFTDRAVMAIAENLRPGMPEYELSAHIQASFLKDGGALMFHFLGATPMDRPERRTCA